MKQRGFTLIEVMVVLSILAIVAILGYNMFGSTLKEANDKSMKTNVFKNMNTLMLGYEEMQRKGLKMDFTIDWNGADLVEAGILKNPIVATNQDWWGSDASGPCVLKNTTTGFRSWYDVDGDAAADMVLYLSMQANSAKCGEICGRWNLEHTGTYTGPNMPSEATSEALGAAGHKTWCGVYAGSSAAIIFKANHLRDLLP